MRGWIGMLAAGLLAGCAGQVAGPRTAPAAAPVSVQIIAFNDFHGNLEAGKLAVEVPGDGGTTTRLPGGGAAYFASAVAKLREGHPNSDTVSAGDMTYTPNGCGHALKCLGDEPVVFMALIIFD